MNLCRELVLAIIPACETKSSGSGEVTGRQLLRCGTSVSANYRAACRARSHAHFVVKMGIVVG